MRRRDFGLVNHEARASIRRAGFALIVGTLTASGSVFLACGSDKGSPGFGGDAGIGADASADATVNPDSSGDDGGINFGDAMVSGDQGSQSPIPKTCAESENRHSYIGCDYWPTVTLNPVYEAFDFAVAVSNPQAFAVTVTVSGGALPSAKTVMVPANAVVAIPLPWVTALKGPSFDQNTAVGDPGKSRIVVGGAYHVQVDFPVSVYQFSALQYEIDAGAPCPGYGDGGAGPHCYSFSNDATLLLPSTVATGDYPVLAWPSFGATPGFLAVTATQDGTSVTVYPGGRVQGVPNAGPPIMIRGDQHTYALNRGDVLEMFSDTGDIRVPKYGADLSGSIIHADKPVVTYAGHGCTFIPENKKACDHLESSMFPVQTLGTQYIVSLPHTPHGEHQWVRLMGLYDNTSVAFDPPVSGRNGVLLNTGDVVDLPDVDKSFAMVANGRIAVNQYMLGEYANVTDGGTPNPDLGDPSQSPAISLLQYRTTYTFLAPSTYSENWIDVIAALGTIVTLDGVDIPVSTYTQVGGQPFGVAHVQLTGASEGHEIHGSSPFGLIVYGYGSRTSYMYPGGLDLRVVFVPPPPPPR